MSGDEAQTRFLFRPKIWRLLPHSRPSKVSFRTGSEWQTRQRTDFRYVRHLQRRPEKGHSDSATELIPHVGFPLWMPARTLQAPPHRTPFLLSTANSVEMGRCALKCLSKSIIPRILPDGGNRSRQ